MAAVNLNITEQQVRLEWKRFYARSTIPACVGEMDVRVALDHIFDQMVIQATGYVLGERLPSHTETETGSTTFEAPASWWQHFKHQHGHRWWLRALVRRRPVRMVEETRSLTVTATWEHMAAYPWADRTAIPADFRFGASVDLRWLTSSTDWS